jgi:hypothetical protein
MLEIVVWGAIALSAAVAGAILAKSKNRNLSSWSAWCLLLPPLVAVLYLLPKATSVPQSARNPLNMQRRANRDDE